MNRTATLTALGWIGCAIVVIAQPGQPRRVGFDRRPIVAIIEPADRHIILVHPTLPPLIDYPEPDEYLSEVVKWNPIIFVGRVVQKQPAFMNLRTRQQFTPVPMNQANWIGSEITVLVDRTIQTLDGFPLRVGQRLSFLDDGDGTAVVNGVRVDAGAPWLVPIETGRRYLTAGRIEDERFLANGMWMEPLGGGNMRPRFRGDAAGMKMPFAAWTVDEASVFLEREVHRRR